MINNKIFFTLSPRSTCTAHCTPLLEVCSATCNNLEEEINRLSSPLSTQFHFRHNERILLPVIDVLCHFHTRQGGEGKGGEEG